MYEYVCMIMDVCMDGWMYGWMDVWMDAWMHGCMHVCMHVCLFVCMYVKGLVAWQWLVLLCSFTNVGCGTHLIMS